MRQVLVTPPSVTLSATLASGSPSVTVADTSKIQAGSKVAGTGIPALTIVQSVNSPTSLTLNQNVTVTGSQNLTFGVEPLDLVSAKNFLRVDITDDDYLISRLIVAARTHCETRLRQALITQTWKLELDSFPSAGGYYNRAIREVWPSLGGLPSGLGFYPGMIPNSTGTIDIPSPPLQTINSVQYYDFQNVLQTVDPSLYNVSTDTPARIQPAYSHVWPVSRPTIDSVIITFTAGYGDTGASVPENITTAIMMMLNHWYQHRDAVADSPYLPIPDTVDTLLASSDHGAYA